MNLPLAKLVSFLFACAVAVITYAEQGRETPPFDYSQASNIIVYTGDGKQSLWFPKPLETDTSRGPAILYRDLLSAISESLPVTSPLAEHRYIMDIQSEGGYKRLYVGGDWISDGESISFFQDLNPVLNHIESRMAVGTLADYSTKHTEAKYAVTANDGDNESASGDHELSREEELESLHETLDVVTAMVESDYQKSLGQESPEATAGESESSGKEMETPQQSKAAIAAFQGKHQDNAVQTGSAESVPIREASLLPDEPGIDDESMHGQSGRGYLIWLLMLVIALVIVIWLVVRASMRRRDSQFS